MPRDSTGVVTLPVGNPVVAGTAISADVQNATIADLASMIEDSLSRSGKGGMNAPMQFADGSAAVPSLAFTSDPDTGVYRYADGEVGISGNGVLAARINTSNSIFTGSITSTANIAAANNITANGTISAVGAISVRRSDLPTVGQAVGAGAGFSGAPLVISDFSSEINLPTATGRPIIVFAQVADNSTANRFKLTSGTNTMNGSIYLYRKIGVGAYAAIARQYYTVEGGTKTINLSFAPFIDTPGAGSITYKLCYVVSDNTGDMGNEGMVLAAYEL